MSRGDLADSVSYEIKLRLITQATLGCFFRLEGHGFIDREDAQHKLADNLVSVDWPKGARIKRIWAIITADIKLSGFEGYVNFARSSRYIGTVGKGFVWLKTTGISGIIDSYETVLDDDAIAGQSDDSLNQLLSVVLAELTEAAFSEDDYIAALGDIVVIGYTGPGARNLPYNEFIGILQGVLHARTIDLIGPEHKCDDKQRHQQGRHKDTNCRKQIAETGTLVL